MKKLFSIFLLTPFLLMSCYIFDYSGNSRIAIRLASMPAGIKAVHVAVYSGNPDDRNLLSKEVLTTGSIGDIVVTAGENRYFVFLGENMEGLGEYYGISGPYTIKEDEVTNVIVSMDHIILDDLFQLDFRCSPPHENNYSWNTLPGATNYNLWAVTGEGPNAEPIFGLLRYSGNLPFTFGILWDSYYDHAVEAYFGDFDKYSIKSDIVGSGC